MSSSSKTSNLHLSQFAGTDKPTFTGDYTHDMALIDTLFNASGAALQAAQASAAKPGSSLETLINAITAAPTKIAPTLQNGWFTPASGSTPDRALFYYKNTLEEVCVEGAIGGGTITNATLLWTFPIGMRPTAPLHFIGLTRSSTSGSSSSWASVVVRPDGTVVIDANVAANYLALNFRFLAEQ